MFEQILEELHLLQAEYAALSARYLTAFETAKEFGMESPDLDADVFGRVSDGFQLVEGTLSAYCRSSVSQWSLVETDESGLEDLLEMAGLQAGFVKRCAQRIGLSEKHLRSMSAFSEALGVADHGVSDSELRLTRESLEVIGGKLDEQSTKLVSLLAGPEETAAAA